LQSSTSIKVRTAAANLLLAPKYSFVLVKATPIAATRTKIAEIKRFSE